MVLTKIDTTKHSEDEGRSLSRARLRLGDHVSGPVIHIYDLVDESHEQG